MVTLLIGLFIGIYFLGQIVHEESHALACILLGVPFIYSSTQVNTIALSGFSGTVVGLSGGLGEALVALFFFWISTFFEKHKSNWFLAAIGFEIAFLTFVFMGISNAIWEGLFNESYKMNFSNPITLSVLFLPSMIISALLVQKWKMKKAIAELKMG
jgi:hypothetical protein